MGRDRVALVGEQPHGFRLGDQIADRQNQAVGADEDAVAGALGAENLGGEGVFRYFGAQRENRGQSGGEVESAFLRFRLVRRRDFPIQIIGFHSG